MVVGARRAVPVLLWVRHAVPLPGEFIPYLFLIHFMHLLDTDILIDIQRG